MGKSRWLGLVLGVLCLVLVFSVVTGVASAEVFYGPEPPKGDWDSLPLLRITFFAAGQNDCILVESNGETMLIDGARQAYGDTLISELDARGITKLTYIFNTHYHDDHLGGIYALLKHGMQAEAYLHPYAEDEYRKDKLLKRTMAQAAEAGIPVIQIFAGDEIILGNTTIRLYRCEEYADTNAESVMERIMYGDASILLTADVVGKAQHYFANNIPAEELKADIVKAPHHGITPMVPKFLDTIHPETIVVTSTRRHKPRVELQAKARGIEMLCSGSGTIVAETDGVDWYVRQLTK